MKKTKEETVKWLLENRIDEDGNINISNLDFGEFKGNLLMDGMRLKRNIDQSQHENEGYIYQYGHKNKGHILQGGHENRDDVLQSAHANKGDISQSRHGNKGNILQYEQKNEGRVIN